MAAIPNINNTNYFKILDLAALLNSTSSQFNVEYDATRNTVVLTTGQGYSGKVGTDFRKSASALFSLPPTPKMRAAYPNDITEGERAPQKITILLKYTKGGITHEKDDCEDGCGLRPVPDPSGEQHQRGRGL